MLSPGSAPLGLEQRRSVDDDERECRFAQLAEQHREGVRGYKCRRGGLAGSENGQDAGAPRRGGSRRLDDHPGSRLGIAVPRCGEDLGEPGRPFHSEELLERRPAKVGIDDERGLPGLRESTAQTGRHPTLALVCKRAGHEQHLLTLRGELGCDHGGQGVEGVPLGCSAGRAAARVGNLGHDRDAAEALQIAAFSHPRRDPLAAERNEDGDEERRHECKSRVPDRAWRRRLGWGTGGVGELKLVPGCRSGDAELAQALP